MKYVTYSHHKPDGSMFYIGKGTLKRARSPLGRNIVWQRTVEKHGGFKVEILAQWETEKEAFDHEIFLIDTMRSMGVQLTNMVDGGLGASGLRHTEERKNAVRKMMLERNPMKIPEIRKKHADAVKIAMSRPEVRSRQSAIRVGKRFSASHIESLRVCHPTRPCIINGVEYKSLMEASRELGIRHGTLYRWLNNQNVAHNKKYRHITECRWK